MVADVVEFVTQRSLRILAHGHEIGQTDAVGTVNARHFNHEIADIVGNALVELEQHGFILEIVDNVFRSPAKDVRSKVDDGIQQEIVGIFKEQRRSGIIVVHTAETVGIVLRIDCLAFRIADKTDHAAEIVRIALVVEDVLIKMSWESFMRKGSVSLKSFRHVIRIGADDILIVVVYR